MRRREFSVVIEGAGDVVEQYYAPAIRAVRAHASVDMRVTFCDLSASWNGSAKEQKMCRIRDGVIAQLPAYYVDKSEPAHQDLYASLQPDIIIVATPEAHHMVVAERWRRADTFGRMLIEKPLADDVDKVGDFLGALDPSPQSGIAHRFGAARECHSAFLCGAGLTARNIVY